MLERHKNNMIGKKVNTWGNIPHAPPFKEYYVFSKTSNRNCWAPKLSGLWHQFASIHYGWSTVFTNRGITAMPLFDRGRIGTAGRLLTHKLSFSFMGLYTCCQPAQYSSSLK